MSSQAYTIATASGTRPAEEDAGPHLECSVRHVATSYRNPLIHYHGLCGTSPLANGTTSFVLPPADEGRCYQP
jgi:hypothetical protein